MSKFKADVSLQSVSTLVIRIGNEDEKIILDPAYQRNIVWNMNDMANFINSVLNGIVPNNILFNIDEKGNYICIDGKQRLTSLVEFKYNKIFGILFDNNNDNDIIYVYYSVIPQKYINDIQFRILTQEEKNTFNSMMIPITTYTNLSYEDQIDVFHRIQSGKVLTNGEKIIAFFSDDKITKYFLDFCDKKSSLFKKFLKNDLNRKEHVIRIITIMYMISKNVCMIPTNRQKQLYLKSIDRFIKIKKELALVDHILDICFGPQLLGHASITCKLQQNMYYVMTYFVYVTFINKQILEHQFIKLRIALNNAHKDIINMNKSTMLTKKDIKTIENIYKLINYNYNLLIKSELDIDIDNEYSEISLKNKITEIP